jgi:hypothetical protein
MKNASAGLRRSRQPSEHATIFTHDSPLECRLRWWLSGYFGDHGPSWMLHLIASHKIFSLLQGVRCWDTQICSLPRHPRDGHGRPSKHRPACRPSSGDLQQPQCASGRIGTVDVQSLVSQVDSKGFEEPEAASIVWYCVLPVTRTHSSQPP